MFPRISPWALGARVRCYSTSGDSSKAGFLSDLMKRIDSINLRAENIAKTSGQTPVEKPKSQKAFSGKKPQKKAFAPKNTPYVPAKAKIAVKDHPLSSNMFKLMDEKNFQRSSGPSAKSGANHGPKFRENSGSRDGKQPARNGATPTARNQQFGARKPANRKPGFNKRSKISTRSGAASKPASIVPKKLQSAALKPTLTGDVFFYGKPAKLGLSASSRTAAVAKECLLKSKYPYRLPKSIIDGMDEGFSGNRFLLQKDFDLNVDPEYVQERVRRVVRGEAGDLQAKEDATAAEKEAHRGLLMNGSLSMENKQTIYDVVTGLKSAQDLMKDAAWNK